jgi:hypothetical protein
VQYRHLYRFQLRYIFQVQHTCLQLLLQLLDTEFVCMLTVYPPTQLQMHTRKRQKWKGIQTRIDVTWLLGFRRLSTQPDDALFRKIRQTLPCLPASLMHYCTTKSPSTSPVSGYQTLLHKRTARGSWCEGNKFLLKTEWKHGKDTWAIQQNVL